MKRIQVLVLGITGMLGNAMFRVFAENNEIEVFGTIRTATAPGQLAESATQHIIRDVDVLNHDSLVRAFGIARPQVVVNCVGIVKQLADSDDPLQAVPINTLLPHRLAALCAATGARLVHISTDCVFSGIKGNYSETDFPDANDLYGRTKLLGEVDYPHAITLRTSLIGHELSGRRSLINWFLAQEGSVTGYTRAVFSGLPTVELARVVRDVVIPRPELNGVFHVAAAPIAKCELLRLVAAVYGKAIDIISDSTVVIDRSLNASRFRVATSYVSPAWPQLVRHMYQFH